MPLHGREEGGGGGNVVKGGGKELFQSGKKVINPHTKREKGTRKFHLNECHNPYEEKATTKPEPDLES